MGRSRARGANEAPDTLFGQVTHRLAVAIVGGELSAGALVPGAEDLGGSLSASRTAYREAIRFLAGKGLIAARPRSGTRVAQREHWNLLDPDAVGLVDTGPPASDKLGDSSLHTPC